MVMMSVASSGPKTCSSAARGAATPLAVNLLVGVDEAACEARCKEGLLVRDYG